MNRLNLHMPIKKNRKKVKKEPEKKKYLSEEDLKELAKTLNINSRKY